MLPLTAHFSIQSLDQIRSLLKPELYRIKTTIHFALCHFIEQYTATTARDPTQSTPSSSLQLQESFLVDLESLIKVNNSFSKG